MSCSFGVAGHRYNMREFLFQLMWVTLKYIYVNAVLLNESVGMFD